MWEQDFIPCVRKMHTIVQIYLLKIATKSTNEITQILSYFLIFKERWPKYTHQNIFTSSSAVQNTDLDSNKQYELGHQ